MEKIEKHFIDFEAFLKKAQIEFSSHFKGVIKPATNIDEYMFLRKVGQGSYGQVYLVRNKCRVFIVSPYVDGFQFFEFLRRAKNLQEEVAKFYAGQVVLALEYLHFMGIIYRDLKPENLMVDSLGYLKLIDFGFAKKPNRGYTYTFCGTPEFIAPEVILNKGYTFSADWWSLGILIYELCAGLPPFASENPQKVFEKILGGRVTWPQGFSSNLKSLAGGLLKVDKTMRLGCMKNQVKDIKCHKWFADIDWTQLWFKKLPPPIIPYRRKEKSKALRVSFDRCSTNFSPSQLSNIDFSV